MKEYINTVHKLIEKTRNELRSKVVDCDDERLKKMLDNYEDAYYQSCLKIEKYMEEELKEKDLVQHD